MENLNLGPFSKWPNHGVSKNEIGTNWHNWHHDPGVKIFLNAAIGPGVKLFLNAVIVAADLLATNGKMRLCWPHGKIELKLGI